MILGSNPMFLYIGQLWYPDLHSLKSKPPGGSLGSLNDTLFRAMGYRYLWCRWRYSSSKPRPLIWKAVFALTVLSVLLHQLSRHLLFNIQLLEFIDSSKFLLSRPLVPTAIALVIMWEFQKILMFLAVSSMMLKIPGNA